MASLLFEVSPMDPLTCGHVPALRATGVNPVTALRATGVNPVTALRAE